MTHPATSGGAGISRYQKLDKIGEGTYGTVYKAKDKTNGDLVALKCIRLDNEEEGVTCTAIREVSLLKELKHPNIVKLHTVDLNEKKLTLVFEYLDMDLKNYLDNNKGHVTLDQVRNFMRQLLMSIHYCHHRNVLHRDLKPQNLLIRQATGELKLADFGLGKSCGIPVNKLTSEVVTLWYRAPDVLLGSNNYGPGVDLWAVGCIFCEMVTSKALVTGRTDTDQLGKIFKFLGTPDTNIWPSMNSYPNSKMLTEYNFPTLKPGTHVEYFDSVPFKTLGKDGVDLIKQFLRYEPSQRIPAVEALTSPFFTS
ncbi:Cell division protein kinase 2-like protein CRK1 [Diplonema papillatum]|nr:Cell division protein kinase 2-like protein CRK1 [Diplonema papillatum]